MYLVTKNESGEILELFNDKESTEIPPGAVGITNADGEALRKLPRLTGTRMTGRRVVIPRTLVAGIALDNNKNAALQQLREIFHIRLNASRLELQPRDIGLLRLLSSGIDVATASQELRRTLLCIETHDNKRDAIMAATDQPALDALVADFDKDWPQ